MPPKASAKPAKKAGVSDKARRSSGHKKGNSSRDRMFSLYVYKILKQVHPDTSISSTAMSIMNSFVNDVLDRIGKEASHLTRYGKRCTMSSEDIQTAVRLLLPGDLRDDAIRAGKKAVSMYNRAK
ncbi:core histone H2A/H2B/H3/H4 [Trichuris suis]|nr:core histone H2A/H2B/H3/H4 [Trichuris suis]